MRTLEEIRRELADCDHELIHQLMRRMSLVSEIIPVKRESGIPIFQPDVEQSRLTLFDEVLENENYRKNILHIFDQIVLESKKIQAEELIRGNIAIIGFMGVGKTSVAACLKDMLAMDVVDTDAMIVERQGMSVNQIFEYYGENYFRNCESNTIIGLRNLKQTVISCGGGAVLRPENVENLKKCSRIVLLTASPETILERVKDSDDRPILRGNKNVDFIAKLMEKRRSIYENAADVVVNTDGKSIYQVCEEIITKPISSKHKR